MREGCFEVTLHLVKTGQRLNEVVINGSTYFEAVPGEEYSVKVNVYRNELGLFPLNYIRIALYVDGADVNYWKRLDLNSPQAHETSAELPITATFVGFKKSDTDIRAFSFADIVSHEGSGARTSGGNATTSASVLASAGNIKVDVFEAVPVGGIFSNQSGCHEVPSSSRQAVDHTTQNVKFWTQPSVSTLGGRRLQNAEKFDPVGRWENVPHPVTGSRNDPTLTLNAKYHNPSMLTTLQRIFSDDDESGGGSGGAAAVAGGDVGSRMVKEILNRKRNASSMGSSSSSSGAANKRNTAASAVDLTNSDAEDGDAAADTADADNNNNSSYYNDDSCTEEASEDPNASYVRVRKEVPVVEIDYSSDEGERDGEGGDGANGSRETRVRVGMMVQEEKRLVVKQLDDEDEDEQNGADGGGGR